MPFVIPMLVMIGILIAFPTWPLAADMWKATL
jgi:hypothetical protein